MSITTRRRPSGRGVARLVLVAVVAAVAAASLTACEPARPVDKTRPVLLLHGFNLTDAATDCGSTFDALIASLRKQGFTGPMVKVGWYSGDTHCDVNLHSYGTYDDRDSWRTIAKSFNAYVYQTYTSKKVAVDAVGYSMGGLIVRGGVYGALIGESGFGKPIDVQDSVTLAAPHDGAAWYSYFCWWGQCGSMRPGNGDLDWLNRNGNPQGLHGTDWTAVGSTDDAVVPDESALFLSIPASNKVLYTDIPHTGDTNYMHDARAQARTGAALAAPAK
jgi:hypothetical protein